MKAEAWIFASCTMRSLLVRTPTTVPVVSSTGAPSMPRSTIRCMASRTLSSGENARTSVVITDETGVERAMSFLQELGERGGQVSHDVARHQASRPG